LRVIALLLGAALTRKCWYGAWEGAEDFWN
jgi:hypothetical protein